MIVIDQVIAQLRRSHATIRELATGLNQSEALWRPSEGSWSILEVLAHLLDEEQLDFRARIALVLEDPSKEWPPIDPPAWVEAHDYRARELDEVLTAFGEERRRSLEIIDGWRDADWDLVHKHPQMGSLRAGDLLISWMAHDLLHIRQITRLHRERIVASSGRYSAEYAGPW